MFTFIICLIAVFVLVDLFVRFIIEPLADRLDQKNKISKSYAPKLDPSFRLATETMYDGGKPINPESSSNSADEGKISESEVKS